MTAQAISIASTVYHGGNAMNPDSEFDEPLTDKEFDFLERFLSSNAVCDDAMDAVMLHGFLTAVISGPNVIMPCTVLPWIWDARQATRQPRFLSDQGQAASRGQGYSKSHVPIVIGRENRVLQNSLGCVA